jgi:hypothetical protein
MTTKDDGIMTWKMRKRTVKYTGRFQRVIKEKSERKIEEKKCLSEVSKENENLEKCDDQDPK